MKEFHHANEYHKLPSDPLAPPAEMSRLPAEMSQLPAEYQIPEEFPTHTSKQSAAKKSHARRLIAMCLTGFVTIQVMFNYFVPATNESKPQPSLPGVQTPTNPGSGSGGNSSIDIGDFSVHAAADSVQDSMIIDGIKEAYWDFDHFDYVRASIALQDVVYQYRLDYDPYALDCVAYVVDGGVVYDFGEQELDVTFRNYGSFVYFKTDRFVYEDKDGEIQSYDLLYTYLITFVDMGSTTVFRVLMIEDILSEYMLYGLSNDWDFNGYYTYGEFDGQGRCSNCERTEFFVSNYSATPNFDRVYDLRGVERYRGRVENGAFMNGTMLILDLLYSEESNDFDTDIQKPANVINFDALDRDGKLDLDHETVINAGSDYGEGPWLQFQDDPNIKYLANDTFVTVKYDQYDDPWDTYTIEIPDPTRPLLPIDITPAFALHKLVLEDLGELGDSGNKGDNSGGDGGDVGDDEAGNQLMAPAELTDDLAAGIMEASRYFMDGDYVRTGAYFAKCLSDHGIMYFENDLDSFSGLYDRALYCDGSKMSPVTEYGLSGCYFHFEKDTNWWIGNSETKTHFPVMRVTITRTEETAKGRLFRVVQFQVGVGGQSNVVYVDGDLVTDHGDGIRYIEGVFDGNGNSDACSIVVFDTYYTDWNYELNVDGKLGVMGIRQLSGPVRNGAFVSGTMLYEKVDYDMQTNAMVPVATDYTAVIDFVTDSGIIDRNHSAVADRRNSDTAFEAYQNDDAIKCLISKSMIQIKQTAPGQSWRSLQVHDLDVDKPVFPLDMSIPLMFD